MYQGRAMSQTVGSHISWRKPQAPRLHSTWAPGAIPLCLFLAPKNTSALLGKRKTARFKGTRRQSLCYGCSANGAKGRMGWAREELMHRFLKPAHQGLGARTTPLPALSGEGTPIVTAPHSWCHSLSLFVPTEFIKGLSSPGMKIPSSRTCSVWGFYCVHVVPCGLGKHCHRCMRRRVCL